MSTYIIKIIPLDYEYYISIDKAEIIKSFMSSQIKNGTVEYHLFEMPHFIDCGENLERISCPFCKAQLSEDWWGEEMNSAFENNFLELDLTLPCCGNRGNLNWLIYDFPCGFSRVEFAVIDPNEPPDDITLRKIAELMGHDIRLIHPHY